MVVIRRWEDEERWQRVGKWRLVYGRRKTGKSFFVRNFTKWDAYFFVYRSGKVREIKTNEVFSYKEFFKVLPYLLERKGIVIDEFHRMGDELLDLLHSMGSGGELTLITSSKFYAKQLLHKHSPLLGLLTPYPLGLISPLDLVRNLPPEDPSHMERLLFLQEPWLIGKLGSDLRTLVDHLPLASELVGEIFKEEDRQITEMYEAIMTAVGAGRRTLADIKSFISGKKPTAGSDIYPYIKILIDMDILSRIKVFGKRTSFYVHTSPFIDLYFYLYDRLGYPEIDVNPNTVLRYLRDKVPFYIEQFIRRFFSELFGLSEGVYVGGDKEIDIVLHDGKKPRVVAEVKWKERISKKEVKNIERKLDIFEGVKKILFVKDKNGVPETELEVWDVETLAKLSKDASLVWN